MATTIRPDNYTSFRPTSIRSINSTTTTTCTFTTCCQLFEYTHGKYLMYLALYASNSLLKMCRKLIRSLEFTFNWSVFCLPQLLPERFLKSNDNNLLNIQFWIVKVFLYGHSRNLKTCLLQHICVFISVCWCETVQSISLYTFDLTLDVCMEISSPKTSQPLQMHHEPGKYWLSVSPKQHGRVRIKLRP